MNSDQDTNTFDDSNTILFIICSGISNFDINLD